MLLQMVGGGLVNGVLEAPLFRAPGFLVNAAPHSHQLAFAALLGVATEALWVAIAVTAFPIFGQRNRPMALGFVTGAAVAAAVAVVENIGVMSMVSVSEAYAKASAGGREHLEAVRVVVASARNWAHFMGRIVGGAAIFLFDAALYRFALVPRVLSGFGMIAALLMIATVGMPFFGHDVVFPLLAPVGLAQLILATWLVAKGLRGEPISGIERGV